MLIVQSNEQIFTYYVLSIFNQQLRRNKYIFPENCRLLRKDIDVNEHERLFQKCAVHSKLNSYVFILYLQVKYIYIISHLILKYFPQANVINTNECIILPNSIQITVSCGICKCK